MLVFLLGMPGAGKTTLGAALANLLGFAFTDLDSLIEERENSTIPEIFTVRGEAYFREVEASELRSLAVQQNMVVATGGGTPCFHDNLNWMNSAGLTVFLHVSAEVIAKRLAAGNQTGRPLLGSSKLDLQQKLEQTFSERIEFYSRAQYTIIADNISASELAQLLRNRFRI